MVTVRLITTSHIADWAARRKRDCQGMLPILVRRLVRATATRVDHIDFPGGDAVSDEGWDGRLTCSSASPFVPDGISGWEIGTDKSAETKAGTDYEKRSGDPLDLSPASTTFVFVTPRAWPRRHAWVRDRKAEGRWRDVRVIAAGDLEQWLEDAPAVALWLARHLNLAPVAGFAGIEERWNVWANGTRPAITAAMLVAGREREVAATRTWLERPSDKLEVQADALDEATAFLSAAAVHWPEPLREALFARCVVTTTEEAFRAAAAWSPPLVIAAHADVAQVAAGEALRRGHHLYLAVGRTLAARGQGPLRLPRIDGFALRQALAATGMSREEAAGVVAECGRSIAVLYRRRAVTEAVRRPPWASPGTGEALVPALLAGSWSEAVRPTEAGPLGPAPLPLLDRSVLCSLAGGRDYDAVAAPLKRACAGDDPPLRRAADVWRLTAALDAWYLLHGFVERHDLERLADAATEVLAAPDPKYDLPDEQQWMAAIHGKERQHSGWLRQGLAISLAIVAHHGEQLRLPVPHGTSQGYVHRVVERVLSRLEGWQGWASIDDVLPLLAEAAPEAVLSAIEDLAAGRPDDVRSLLTDGGGDGLTGECRHAGMLWALERLAWHPDHLARCIRLLAQLDELDPGSRWANRPFATLSGVLIGPGDPYTYADVAGCLAAVDELIAHAPQVAWRLFLRAAEPLRSRIVQDPPAYLPARPDGWEPWAAEAREEFWEGMRQRLRGLIEAGDHLRISEALQHLEFLPPGAQAAVVARLADETPAVPAGGEDPIWPAVRGALHRVRSYRRDRPLASGIEDALDRAYERFAPSDPVGKAAWLFQEHDPQLAEGEYEDWREHRCALEQRRTEAARDLLGTTDAPALVGWATGLPNAYAFGIALADAADDAADAVLAGPMLSLPQANSDGAPPLLLAYARRKSGGLAAAWFERWSAAAAELHDSAPALAALHCVLPSTAETWRRVEGLGPAVEQLYWRWNWGPPEDTAPPEDWAHAIDRLLTAGRTEVALRSLFGSGTPVLPGPLLVRLARVVLERLGGSDGRAGPNLLWELEQLFEQIDRATDVPQHEAAALEWRFLPLLVHTRRGPRVLHQMLASDPALFVQMICLNYKRRDGAVDPEQEGLAPDRRRSLANLAAQLLSSWKSPLPGDGPTGLDQGALAVWVAEARRLCAEAGRAEIGDQKIGELLARSPVDPTDGAWPHRAVRQVLGSARSEHLDTGFCIGVYNGRGVTSRGLRDGGAQERAEADRCEAWAKAIRPSAPHAARLLVRIADDYRAQAKRHDDDAERNDLL